jgi:probable rRNA maturation factor
MILLDPDLDPEHADKEVVVKRPGATAASATQRSQRIPSVPLLSRFLREAQAAAKLRGKVTVLLTTDRAMRRLNRQFRGKNKATDVLSFPAGGPAAEDVAGDLAISIPTARRQAAECGHPLSTEIKVLMLHGVLHLAGFDHEVDEGEMARRERGLRARLRLPQGLIERAGRTQASHGHSSLKRAKGART